ncbi:Protein of unknown function [Cohnella sp. OV330]|uniref:DUF2634 domain-containing protein n=1 Tax=Cohnella sp. OV330 TaxID=1855288 RepID=UPI0008F06EB7|nr:DUF2634 domain-containing protein [Cohnella sp. OV330]SFB62554.1 Protein of unknown function [Cohnella sp. OV330]
MSLPEVAQLEMDTVPDTSSGVVHKSFAWDFESGDFAQVDGKTVEISGIEYLRVWIQKALMTTKNVLIYADTGYGSEHHLLIGQNLHPAFSQAEYERMIQEALLTNDAITQVGDFNFSQHNARLTISFGVTSIYGSILEAVTV